MAIRLVTPPANEPVSLAEAKAHLRVDINDENSLIMGYVAAARQHVETAVLSSALISQTWELVLDVVPGTQVVMPRPPLQSVTSITFTDREDNATVVDSDNYLVDTSSWPGRVRLRDDASWPAVQLREIGGVVIRFVAGYGDAHADVPAPIRQALLLIIGDMYENREESIMMPGLTTPPQMPYAARRLLDDYRRRVF